jgi:hypothetical protein
MTVSVPISPGLLNAGASASWVFDLYDADMLSSIARVSRYFAPRVVPDALRI